jgi:hypothetical protein
LQLFAGAVDDIQRHVEGIQWQVQDIRDRVKDIHRCLEDQERAEEDDEEEDMPSDNTYAHDIDLAVLLAAVPEDDYQTPEEEASDIESVSNDDHYNDSDSERSNNSSTGGRQTHEFQQVIEDLLFIGQTFRVDRTRPKLLVRHFPEK